MNTDLSELSKALGRKGVEVFLRLLCTEEWAKAAWKPFIHICWYQAF